MLVTNFWLFVCIFTKDIDILLEIGIIEEINFKSWAIFVSFLKKKKSNLSLYSLYYAEAYEMAGAPLRVIVPGQHSSFRRNIAAMNGEPLATLLPI